MICYKPSSSVLITPDNKVGLLPLPSRYPYQEPFLCIKTPYLTSHLLPFLAIVNQGEKIKLDEVMGKTESKQYNVQDYFYICAIHLKDKGFCSPIIDEAEVAEKRKKEEMDREIEKVKKEYEEKQRRKKEKQKAKDKDKDEDKDKKDGDDGKKKGDDEEQKKDEKEKDDKVSAFTSGCLYTF